MLGRDWLRLDRKSPLSDDLKDRYHELEEKLGNEIGNLVLVARDESYLNRRNLAEVRREQYLGVLTGNARLNVVNREMVIPLEKHAVRNLESGYRWVPKEGFASVPLSDLYYLGISAEKETEFPSTLGEQKGFMVYCGSREIEDYFSSTGELWRVLPQALDLLKIEPSERLKKWQGYLEQAKSEAQ